MSLFCGRCGTRLSADQTEDLAAVNRVLARMGGWGAELFPPIGRVMSSTRLMRLRRFLFPTCPVAKSSGECARGQGHIANFLRRQGHTVVGGPDVDFLKDTMEADLIVTNPPYSCKDKFLARAYEIGKPWAFLLPCDSLVAVERFHLFHEHGIQLLIPNRRVHFIHADEVGTPFNSFWVCWRLLPQDIIFTELIGCPRYPDWRPSWQDISRA